MQVDQAQRFVKDLQTLCAQYDVRPVLQNGKISFEPINKETAPITSVAVAPALASSMTAAAPTSRGLVVTMGGGDPDGNEDAYVNMEGVYEGVESFTYNADESILAFSDGTLLRLDADTSCDYYNSTIWHFKVLATPAGEGAPVIVPVQIPKQEAKKESDDDDEEEEEREEEPGDPISDQVILTRPLTWMVILPADTDEAPTLIQFNQP